MKLLPKRRWAFAACLVLAAAMPALGAEPKRPAKAEPPPPPDPYLSLVVCRAETQRNAKLYALRAHGIRLMQSSERSQSRSTQSLEDELDTLSQGLQANPAAAREAERAREAVTTLTEVTVQEPLVSQIAGTERLADQAGESCAKLMQETRAAPPAAQAALVQPLVEMLFLSQRLARRFLAAPLTTQYGPAQRAPVLADAKSFESHLATLRPHAARDPALAHTLLMIDGQWAFQRAALERPRADKGALEYAGRVSETLREILWSEVQRRCAPARQR
jgi:hypothetical protein